MLRGGSRGAAYLGVGRIENHEELGNGPVEPTHEENARGQAVGDQHQACVLAEAPSIYVPDHVILHVSISFWSR